MARVAAEVSWLTLLSPCAKGAAISAARGREKLNPSNPGAQFEEQNSSSRNTAREVPNRVVGKSEIDEIFPEGKPLRASGSTGPGVTVRSAHAAQSPPMLAKGSTLKTTDTYPPHTHNIRKHVQRGACIMYAIQVCVCVSSTLRVPFRYPSCSLLGLSLIPLRAWGGSRLRGRFWRSRARPLRTGSS